LPEEVLPNLLLFIRLFKENFLLHLRPS